MRASDATHQRLVGPGHARPSDRQREAAAKAGNVAAALDQELKARIDDVQVPAGPPLLEDHGLATALEYELQGPDLADGSGVVPALAVAPAAQAQRWAADAERAAFMVAREAAANALRHAQAGHVVVRPDGGPQGLRLEVDDDGIGLTPDRTGWLGIVGMHDSTLAIGAQFTVTGRPAAGTRVTLTWDGVQA